MLFFTVLEIGFFQHPNFDIPWCVVVVASTGVTTYGFYNRGEVETIRFVDFICQLNKLASLYFKPINRFLLIRLRPVVRLGCFPTFIIHQAAVTGVREENVTGGWVNNGIVWCIQ